MLCWTTNFLRLRPVKRKQISEKVAERLNLSVETVDEIVSCYYNSVQRQLSNLTHPQISVGFLGTFFIKRNKLENKLMIYEKALAKLETIIEPTLSQFKSIRELKDDINNFKNMIEILDEMDAKKITKNKEKQIYKLENYESNKTVEGKRKDI
jgi:nucleoid DNA-binding protein